MGELINGRTAEAIKDKILWCCSAMCCGECKYDADGDFCSSDTVLKDAIAMIERIESERDAALAKVPKWISVEERLPEVDERYAEYEYSTEVLVYDGLRRRGAYYCHTTKLWHDSRYEDDTFEVTHWMPLPEPQKEGAHDA